MTNHLMNTYKPLPVSFTKGNGHTLWDQNGKSYFDALCGISVTSLGHNHPAITACIQQQASELLHTSNLYQIAHQQELADILCQHSKMERAFFSNSGAEANEAAIKIARLYGHHKNIAEPQIIVMEHSFHGRTMATLTATGNRKAQAGFEPLVKGFIRAPYNDVAAVQAIADNNKNVVAILVEPVQGEGGINIPDEQYLPELKAICEQNEWLLMLDEIQTGVARSGQLFAFQHYSFLPDVVTLAKALGNGIPIGACLARGTAAEMFQPGHHGSTFGGNPFACKVASTVMQTVINENLADNAMQRGQQLSDALNAAFKDEAAVIDIRHQGLLVGITLDRPCPELAQIALDHGLLINVTASNVIRLLPPINLTSDDINQLTEMLISCIQQFITA